MRRRHCLVTTVGLVLGAASGLGGGACGGTGTGPTPVPTLSTTPAAGQYFQRLRDAWGDPEHYSPKVLRAEVETFLARWPADGLAPLAHVYVALLALEMGDREAADRELAPGATLPPGNTRDLWTVACARRLRMQGNAEGALGLLRPLVGKNPDPVTRALFEEELTLAALSTHRDYEAISYMDAWLRAATDEERPATHRRVEDLVSKLPKDVLLGSLDAMRAQRSSFGYGLEIEQILSKQLVAIATSSGDAELARLLLDADAGAVVVHGEAEVELGELATSRRGMTVVRGRTLGLLLPTDLPALRDESADVLRGVMWALGLPRGVRQRADDGRDAGAVVALHAPCAPSPPTAATPEPSAEEDLHLVTRNDAGSVDRTEGALDELAGEGASIVIAGLEATTATRALAWGQAHGVPVVVIVPPSDASATGDFRFVLGERRTSVLDALARAVGGGVSTGVAPVVDASEVADYPAQGGILGPFTFQPPVSCDIPPVRAGDPRFPLAQWDRARTRGWLLTGAPSCVRDLFEELTHAHVGGAALLTLEAATPPPKLAGIRVVTASAGIVPWAAVGDARDEELERFEQRLGHVGWWSALGRDAATLARIALRMLPADEVSEPKAVAERRARARDGLASAQAPLWSTEAVGWAGARVIPRTVCAVEGAAR